MTTTDTPTLSAVKLSRGVAGQLSASVVVTYDGEAPETLTFVGNVYGGPVVMVTPSAQHFVAQSVTDRIGHPFHIDRAAWVRGFFQTEGE